MRAHHDADDDEAVLAVVVVHFLTGGKQSHTNTKEYGHIDNIAAHCEHEVAPIVKEG